MKIIGLTGGIGSGKTTVAKWFMDKGVPVYNSDEQAKKLMVDNKEVVKKIIQLFGENAYVNKALNKVFIASQVFDNKILLEQLNKIVHPAVFKDFNDWVAKQNSLFVIKEAAILFESGSYKTCDFVITVLAKESIRINRTEIRDGLTKNQIKARIANQWTDEQRAEKSDFIIENNTTLTDLNNSIQQVYNKLLTIK